MSSENRGGAYDDKGNIDHAIADYDKAIEINPKEANAGGRRRSDAEK